MSIRKCMCEGLRGFIKLWVYLNDNDMYSAYSVYK